MWGSDQIIRAQIAINWTFYDKYAYYEHAQMNNNHSIFFTWKFELHEWQ